MNILPKEKKLAVLSALVEGNSIRSTERMTGVHRDTIMRLLVEVGERCQAMLDERMRGFHSRLIQADEIWTYCRCKQQRLADEEQGNPELGDQYVFVALDAESKLIPLFVVGKRDTVTAHRFIDGLRQRLNGNGRVQLTTDGFRAYLTAVEEFFGNGVDFAQLVKVYGTEPAGDGRYAPPKVTETISTTITDNPKSSAYLHVLRRAAELDHPHDVPAVHPADQCLLEEAGEPQGGLGPALRLLQFLPDSPDLAGDACDGGRGDGSGVGTRRPSVLNGRPWDASSED